MFFFFKSLDEYLNQSNYLQALSAWYWIVKQDHLFNEWNVLSFKKFYEPDLKQTQSTHISIPLTKHPFSIFFFFILMSWEMSKWFNSVYTITLTMDWSKKIPTQPDSLFGEPEILYFGPTHHRLIHLQILFL